MPYHICRLSASPYQSSSLLKEEGERFRALGHCYDPNPTAYPELKTIWITNTHTLLDQKFLTSIPKEKHPVLVIHPNSGSDNFSTEFIKNLPIVPMIRGNSIRTNAVCEWYLSHLFSHYAPQLHQSSWDKNRSWPRKLLSEQEVLLIGLGEIGKKLAQSLHPLVKKLRAYDPFLALDQWPSYCERRADMGPPFKENVILCCPSLTPTSKNLVSKDVIEQFPSDACFLNASRGETYDLEALLHFLNEHPHSKAYLDVFPQEPYSFEMIKNHLQRPEQAVLSSHMAGVYENLGDRITNFCLQVVSDYEKFELDRFIETYQSLNLNRPTTKKEML